LNSPYIEELINDQSFRAEDLVNSTLDVSENTILIINNNSEKRLDELIEEALRKNVKKIITSENCSKQNNKIIKVKNYEEIINTLLLKISPSFLDKDYFGITGTNGKTTSGYYLSQLLNENSLFIGTNEDNLFKNITNEKHLTTPKLFNIVKLLRDQEYENTKNIILEVSSHALDQNRLKGIKFKVSGFTNLSQDHLDYHQNMQSYFQSKLKLFSEDMSESFVYIDSEWGKKIKSSTNVNSFSIGTNKKNNICIKKLITKKDRFDLSFEIEGNSYEVSVPLVGPESHLNYLLALSMAYLSNIKNLDKLIDKSNNLKNPKGRYEKIKYKNNNDIVIDFAHTPESIYQAISFSKKNYDKVYVILGAGGDRDKDKRLLMGKAANNADKIIITNDNPRNENEEEIAKGILKGVNLNKDTEVILDRREAIARGIDNLHKDSVLLILGKGHEKTQEFKNGFIEFSDKEEVKKIIMEKI
tara:strand:+ start:1705 stop:3120 length:1416 start_codon:yes stop_codon:yes gene_type:complete